MISTFSPEHSFVFYTIEDFNIPITFKEREGGVWSSAPMFAVVHAPVCKLKETERERDCQIRSYDNT